MRPYGRGSYDIDEIRVGRDYHYSDILSDFHVLSSFMRRLRWDR